jgi:hypothetical protein
MSKQQAMRFTLTAGMSTDEGSEAAPALAKAS